MSTKLFSICLYKYKFCLLVSTVPDCLIVLSVWHKVFLKIFYVVLHSGKVLSKLSYTVPKSTVKDVAECKPGVIEVVLANLRMKVRIFFLFNNFLFSNHLLKLKTLRHYLKRELIILQFILPKIIGTWISKDDWRSVTCQQI